MPVGGIPAPCLRPRASHPPQRLKIIRNSHTPRQSHANLLGLVVSAPQPLRPVQRHRNQQLYIPIKRRLAQLASEHLAHRHRDIAPTGILQRMNHPPITALAPKGEESRRMGQLRNRTLHSGDDRITRGHPVVGQRHLPAAPQADRPFAPPQHSAADRRKELFAQPPQPLPQRLYQRTQCQFFESLNSSPESPASVASASSSAPLPMIGLCRN